MGGTCSTLREARNSYIILVGKREEEMMGDLAVDRRIILQWI
jgi:hypothetical protein